MITDTTQDKQIRRSIIKQVENMDLRLLQRIAYEVRCEELGLYADSWKLYSESSRQMNLYILNDVLYDYTSGMAVIAAESMEQCGQIFMEKFGTGSDYSNKERQKEFDTADFKVIENVNHPAGVVSYVYGGG